jgi:hypothetical protein
VEKMMGKEGGGGKGKERVKAERNDIEMDQM